MADTKELIKEYRKLRMSGGTAKNNSRIAELERRLRDADAPLDYLDSEEEVCDLVTIIDTETTNTIKWMILEIEFRIFFDIEDVTIKFSHLDNFFNTPISVEDINSSYD